MRTRLRLELANDNNDRQETEGIAPRPREHACDHQCRAVKIDPHLNVTYLKEHARSPTRARPESAAEDSLGASLCLKRLRVGRPLDLDNREHRGQCETVGHLQHHEAHGVIENFGLGLFGQIPGVTSLSTLPCSSPTSGLTWSCRCSGIPSKFIHRSSGHRPEHQHGVNPRS